MSRSERKAEAWRRVPRKSPQRLVWEAIILLLVSEAFLTLALCFAQLSDEIFPAFALMLFVWILIAVYAVYRRKIDRFKAVSSMLSIACIGAACVFTSGFSGLYYSIAAIPLFCAVLMCLKDMDAYLEGAERCADTAP